MAKYELLQESFIGNALLPEGSIVDDEDFGPNFKFDPKRDHHLSPIKGKGGKPTTSAPAAARVGGEGRTTDEGEPTNEGGDLT